jgi:hypothetical protein
MTSAAEINSHVVSPESTLDGEEAGVWAQANPTINKLRKIKRSKSLFITFLPDDVFYL